MKDKKEKIVITYGTFDLFHTGHLNLLKRAKALGDKLIVGVTSDSYDFRRGKLNVKQSLSERIENVKKTGLADLIIVEEYEGQKVEDIQKYGVDIFAIGSDWKGKFDYLKNLCEVVYLERTKGISSTQIRNNQGFIRLGIIGYGNIANRFIKEAHFVSGLEVTYVFGLNEKKLSNLAKDYGIEYTTDLSEFFSNVDAVYIATPHNFHYKYSKIALENYKHVLCEKPSVLKQQELEELFKIADKNNVVFLEAIKTAFAPAFIRLISLLKTNIIGNIIDINATFTKIIHDISAREFDKEVGGSVTELASYTLLPIIKLLNTEKMKIDFYPVIKNEIDIYTKICFSNKDSLATSFIGIQAKKEGDLIITGTKGYLYVPAPWWLTKYFEIRDENGNVIQQFSDQFMGDGLRYEIAEFLQMIINKRKETHKLTRNEMLSLAKIIEKFLKYRKKLVEEFNEK